MIMLQNLFRPRPRERLGEALYDLAVRQARDPAFYTTMGVADRIDARFELYTLHVLLLVMRLRDQGEREAETAQLLFDTYVSALDHALRELGVGDISVGKKMRKLGEALYGRRPTNRRCAAETPRRWRSAWPAMCSRAPRPKRVTRWPPMRWPAGAVWRRRTWPA